VHRGAERGGANYQKREGGPNKSNIINSAGIGAEGKGGGAPPTVGAKTPYKYKKKIKGCRTKSVCATNEGTTLFVGCRKKIFFATSGVNKKCSRSDSLLFFVPKRDTIILPATFNRGDRGVEPPAPFNLFFIFVRSVGFSDVFGL
jgi:hypothetical protein